MLELNGVKLPLAITINKTYQERMAFSLPFLIPSRKKRTQFISVDMGSRTTKAVLLERRGDLLALIGYALMDAPIYEKKISAEQMADHLAAVVTVLGGTTKFVTAALGLNDTLVRQIELPQMPVEQMRQVLKVNHKNYLQQDLPNCAFDLYILPPRLETAAEKAAKPVDPAQVGVAPKFKVVAAATKQSIVADFMRATSLAGLTADCLTPGILAPINAFEMAMPEIFAKESVALVDIGFKHTSVSVVDRGELALNRVVNIGGDHLTEALKDTLNISYAEAEGIKVGMAPEVESALQLQVTQLGRELRASLDFFEHQFDRPVSQVFASGATARSEMILQMLNSELLVECKPWNPTAFLQLALPGQQAVEIEHVAPQLAVAVGAALAAY
jgi:type IV pilus assembly protein PilM